MKLMILAMAMAALCMTTTASADEKKTPEVLNFKMNSLEGKEVDLSKYKGKVILMVNVASRCGATPQYEGLQDLYAKYKDKDFVVLGFPSNQFGKQEPGNSAQIREFCTKNYGVTFPMFEKIDVNGDDAAPLYKYLTSEKTNPGHSGRIGWNFEKFLISKDGQVVERFKTRQSPSMPAFTKAIEAELAK